LKKRSDIYELDEILFLKLVLPSRSRLSPAPQNTSSGKSEMHMLSAYMNVAFLVLMQQGVIS
jgi:hypothetical protein